tara:strand:+ start:2236 stop:2820 length:585 start_codon:yes stop_codon:yes gene_type:complete
MEKKTTGELIEEIRTKKSAHQMWLRRKVAPYITSIWEDLLESDEGSGKDTIHSLEFHEAIWMASTWLLPGLEVQVVVDDNWNLFISSGTAGFVGFPKEPKGMKLPIRCWIHTHPFGSAYFSGIDWKTVSVWEKHMDCAYVLGGGNHYGFWEQKNPNELTIYHEPVDGFKDEFRVQVKSESLNIPEPEGELDDIY